MKLEKPTHPGEVLQKEFLEPMGLSQNRLSLALHVSARRINEIVLGKRAITADTALRLAKGLGRTPQYWMGLQVEYELAAAHVWSRKSGRISFQQMLDKHRSLAISERDKGCRFERLMQVYLRTDPQFHFQEVWLWNEFPHRADLGGTDTGIDIVALTAEGDFWAVQCKCVQESAVTDKPAVDSFLATSGRSFRDSSGIERRFRHRL